MTIHNYRSRDMILMIIDVFLIFTSVFLAFALKYEFQFAMLDWKGIAWSIALMTFFLMFFFFRFNLYKKIWRYASIGEMYCVFKSVVIGTLLVFFISELFFHQISQKSIYIIIFINCLLLIGGSRIAWRMWADPYITSSKRESSQERALIIGAGTVGRAIAKELKSQSSEMIYPIAFIDDDPQKKNKQINGLSVMGDRKDILDIVEKERVSFIIIALPSDQKEDIRNIIKICNKTGCKIKIVPSMRDLVTGKISIKPIRNVELEDLLGRKPVHVNLEEIADYIHQKVILVTGAGGSIGSELCRQILNFNPEKLVLLGHGENSIYIIENELRESNPHSKIVPIIADIKERDSIEEIFRMFHPDTIFHAAAHKHVPLMENNPMEAIKNNIYGTKNLVEAAASHKVDRFVMISSDKAVKPTSVMGVTKRIAEMIVESHREGNDTKFAVVRFGNVLGSRGSVIPLFKKQIEKGGPVTITHPDMERYFMTIPEAVQLVIQAGALTRGGELFVLDMGEPVKIDTLAKELIHLSGFKVSKDIPIVYTGMRPGEKLREELLTEQEEVMTTQHNRIFIVKKDELTRKEMEAKMLHFEKMITCSISPSSVRSALQWIVPTYEWEGQKECSSVSPPVTVTQWPVISK